MSCPEWRLTFGKPRFAFQAGQLTLLNKPVPHPYMIVLRHSIQDLPFIEHDPGYHAWEWDWRYYQHSYFLGCVFRRKLIAHSGRT